MKTIEERAKKYSKKQCVKPVAYNAYIAGATEQKAIDDELCTVVWVKIDADHPLPYAQEVIGYNKEWVDEDFNPSGTRIGFLSDNGFFSAKWIDDQDCYVTRCEEGDDYEVFQVLPDGTRKTYGKHEHGNAIEGYLPNMPTHFMLIPNTPDGFTWPYNTGNTRKKE